MDMQSGHVSPGMDYMYWTSFNFQNHPFTNMLLTGHTLIDKIDHFLHLFVGIDQS